MNLKYLCFTLNTRFRYRVKKICEFPLTAEERYELLCIAEETDIFLIHYELDKIREPVFGVESIGPRTIIPFKVLWEEIKQERKHERKLAQEYEDYGELGYEEECYYREVMARDD